MLVHPCYSALTPRRSESYGSEFSFFLGHFLCTHDLCVIGSRILRTSKRSCVYLFSIAVVAHYHSCHMGRKHRSPSQGSTHFLNSHPYALTTLHMPPHLILWFWIVRVLAWRKRHNPFVFIVGFAIFVHCKTLSFCKNQTLGKSS